MTTFAVLATGPSMSQAVADGVRHLRRIAVSDAFRLALDAEALVANDWNWWRAHPEALKFAGRKFSVSPRDRAVELVPPEGLITSTTNSGLVGAHVAIKLFGATRVELYGFDMNGSHFFGPHVGGLPNTKPERFEVFKRQFAQYALPKDVTVVNCTPGSALLCFPFSESTCALAT